MFDSFTEPFNCQIRWTDRLC